MLSSGMFSALAASMAVRSRALPAGSPPPCLAAIVISRISLVNRAPRRASVTAFFRLICFHLLWPAMRYLSLPQPKSFTGPGPACPRTASAPVEVQVHEPGRPVAVLEDDELGRPLDPVPRVVHLLPVDSEDHVRVLLDRAEVPEVVERGPGVGAFG